MKHRWDNNHICIICGCKKTIDCSIFGFFATYLLNNIEYHHAPLCLSKKQIINKKLNKII